MPRNVRVYKYDFTVNSFRGRAEDNVVLMASVSQTFVFNYLKIKVTGNPLNYVMAAQTGKATRGKRKRQLPPRAHFPPEAAGATARSRLGPHPAQRPPSSSLRALGVASPWGSDSFVLQRRRPARFARFLT